MHRFIARLAGWTAVLAIGALTATAEQTTTAAKSPPPVKTPLRHGVFRFTSYPTAWTAAQESNRPILIYATGPNCPYCVRMLNESFRVPHMKRFVVDSFETVYVDRVEQPALTAKLKIRLYPTTIIVAPNNQVLDVIEGYVDAKTLSQRLQTSFAANRALQQTR